MARPIIGNENAAHGGNRDAEKRLTRPCLQQLHVPGSRGRYFISTSRAERCARGKPLIHPAELICLGHRADSFFEKKPEERRSAGEWGGRGKQTFHPGSPDSERGLA